METKFEIIELSKESVFIRFV